MNVVVYCSAAESLPEIYRQAAQAVGKWIGEHGAQLVYGGVHAGLMRETAQATHNAGGKVVGVVPSRKRHVASELNDVMVPTADLNHRKNAMQMLGDVFVVLPGGYGTLDELCTAFGYLSFTSQERPIIIYNPDGIYKHFFALLDDMAARNVLRVDRSKILFEAKTITQLTDYLTKFAQ